MVLAMPGELGEAPVAGAFLVAMEPVEGGGHGAFGLTGAAHAAQQKFVVSAAAAAETFTGAAAADVCAGARPGTDPAPAGDPCRGRRNSAR